MQKLIETSTANSECMQQLMRLMMQREEKAMAEAEEQPTTERRRRMTPKDADVKVFDSTVEEWESWAHVFKRSIRALDP